MAHDHHHACEADDVVGYAEVWRGQAYQQRLQIEHHEIARAVGDSEAGRQEGGSEVELAASPHLNPPHPIPSLGPHRTNLRGEGFQGFLSLKAF